MDRLTMRIKGVAVMASEHEEQHTTQEWIDMLHERLAAYEDTGLEPKKVRLIKNCIAEVSQEYNTMFEYIVKFLTTDGVEVVRCKDCKNFGRNYENETFCSCRNGLDDPKEDDFCSYGERKDGE